MHGRSIENIDSGIGSGIGSLDLYSSWISQTSAQNLIVKHSNLSSKPCVESSVLNTVVSAEETWQIGLHAKPNLRAYSSLPVFLSALQWALGRRECSVCPLCSGLSHGLDKTGTFCWSSQEHGYACCCSSDKVGISVACWWHHWNSNSRQGGLPKGIYGHVLVSCGWSFCMQWWWWGIHVRSARQMSTWKFERHLKCHDTLTSAWFSHIGDSAKDASKTIMLTYLLVLYVTYDCSVTCSLYSHVSFVTLFRRCLMYE